MTYQMAPLSATIYLTGYIWLTHDAVFSAVIDMYKRSVAHKNFFDEGAKAVINSS